MSKSSDKSHQQGLIILQIDGLSHHQFARACESGTMPFLNNLLKQEHYHLHSLYSGVPSSTPAVQGELFYGVRGCVPAFKFMRPQDRKPVHLLDLEVAHDIEQALSREGEPLLKGGSAFSNLFTGGAAESSFCASSLGWDTIIPTSNVFKMMLFALLNAYSVVRVVVLIVLETVLAVIDSIRGIVGGRNLFKELTFVPVRVGTSIVLRELVTIGVKLDAARGLPVIHANFLGYDEQAHRRGPSSKFAHWSLKGIDKAISRIWSSAKHSEHRDYDIWIYSDHGQEVTRSYPVEFSKTIHCAVEDAVARFCTSSLKQSGQMEEGGLDGIEGHRVKLLGNKQLSSWLDKTHKPASVISSGNINVAAMGPLGLVYIDHETSPEQHNKIAELLAQKYHVPMALVADSDSDGDRTAHVWRADGHWLLPADKLHVFGANHAFLDDVCTDIINLCHHDYAGKITLSGWHVDASPISFRIENGAHAGPGEQETHAFALTPEDTLLGEHEQKYLKFTDLYRAAKKILRNDNELAAGAVGVRSITSKCASTELLKAEGCLRVMTYNIHSCIGMDDKVAPKRIARIISMYSPDVIALQEVDVGRGASMHIDQAKLLASELDMHIQFHPVRCIGEEQFGNAVLSRHPMRLIEASALSSKLPRMRGKFAPFNQARGGLHVEIEFNGSVFSIINTHLGLSATERRAQIADLLGEPWHTEDRKPSIICGDFNSAPNQHAYKEAKKRLNDVQLMQNKNVPRKTFPSRYPTLRIDHMFVDKKVAVMKVFVPANHLTKVASDHLPLIADLRLPE